MSAEKIPSSGEQKVQRIQESLVDYLIRPLHKESLWLQQNDFWIIRYRGRSAVLKSTRGLHCLAALLRQPGREFHVSQLIAGPMDGSTPRGRGAVHGRITGRLFAGLPVLDAQAKTEYKRRINELRRDLEEAKRFNDPLRET